jgi:hypothetical protein
MDSYNAKSKQPNRLLVVLLAAVAGISFLWFFSRPASTPLVTKVSSRLLHGEVQGLLMFYYGYYIGCCGAKG